MGRAAPGVDRDGHANGQHGADRVRANDLHGADRVHANDLHGADRVHANDRNASARDRPRPPPTTPREARRGRRSSCLKIRGDVALPYPVSGGDMISGQPLEEADDDDEEYDDEE